jgi:ATP-dependent Clp protease adaptor protein ClpS
MLQVESMRGAMILTRKRRGIDVARANPVGDNGVSGAPPGLDFPGADTGGLRHRLISNAPPGLAGVRSELPDETHTSTVGAAWIMAAKPGTETSPEIDVEEKLKEAFSRGWSVIVWNDPVNLMDYVVYVFKTVLKMNEKDATRHMWEVHQKGKSVVSRETREKSELIVHRLRGFGLNATLEQA